MEKLAQYSPLIWFPQLNAVFEIGIFNMLKKQLFTFVEFSWKTFFLKNKK